LNDPRPTILVTGIAGTLGMRLWPLLTGFRVVGVDLPGVTVHPEIALHAMDLGHESSCVRLVRLLRESGAEAVVHLAVAADPLRHPVVDLERTWQINVAGTGRVMEAITEVNRHGGKIVKFIYPSSVAVYGPETTPMVTEEAPLEAHTLSYAVHKAEADRVVRLRAESLGRCTTFLLRPHLFAGVSVENYMLNAIRGQAPGESSLAHMMRCRQMRLPLLLPLGESYPQKFLQFVHVDDVARLIAWLLQRPVADENATLTLNIAGSGPPISMERCAEIGNAKRVALPSRWLCRKVLTLLWKLGVSPLPPDALPYLAGSCTMSTERLRRLLGKDFEKVIRYSAEAALLDSFAEAPLRQATPAG
jgi:nucleoside-diphosphate-sugar epimerase